MRVNGKASVILRMKSLKLWGNPRSPRTRKREIGRSRERSRKKRRRKRTNRS
jgi:hypothetical protein